MTLLYLNSISLRLTGGAERFRSWLICLDCCDSPYSSKSCFFFLSILFHAFSIAYRIIIVVFALSNRGWLHTSHPLVVAGIFNALALAAVLASFLVLTRMWLGVAATLGECDGTTDVNE